jgi:hypothetical protein
MKQELEEISQSAERWSPKNVLRWAFEQIYRMFKQPAGILPLFLKRQ